LVGLINLLHWGPILVLAIPRSAIADRVTKRRLLMATQAAQACTAFHGGCFPIAAPVIGAVAERFSVSAAFFVWGGGGLAVLAVLTGARRRQRAVATG
jgi:hypothetical protein